MKWRQTVWIVGVLLAGPLYAAPVCAPSASFKPYDYPDSRTIPTTNNLILPTGKPIPAEGQTLIIKGKVLDRECKPIPEATVELWQTGPLGKWQVASMRERATVQPVFSGAGRTYTDMDGSFYFITAFPAPLRYEAPNINIRVAHRGVSAYASALFFEGDVRNDADKMVRGLPASTRKDISIRMQPGSGVELIGTIDIVLSDKAPYQVY